MVDTFSLETQGASLALLHKLDSVRIGTNHDPTLKLLEMEDIARSLRSSHSQWQHLTESHVIGKFVKNALPRVYDIQKQMLEERERTGSLARPSYPQCRSGSSHLRTSSCAAASQSQGKIKPSRSPARVRITPAAVDLVTAVESQADHRTVVGGRGNGGSGGGHGNGGSGGGGFSGGGASSGSSSAATVKPGGRTCWVCKNDQHYVRDSPKHIYQGYGERGHHIKCGKTENAVMAVDMLGRTSTDDDSPVCAEAEVEVYTILETKTGECFVSMMEEE